MGKQIASIDQAASIAAPAQTQFSNVHWLTTTTHTVLLVARRSAWANQLASQPPTHSRYPYNAIIAVVLHLFAREGMRVVVVVFGVQSCCGLYYYYTYYADYIVTKQLTRSCTRLCEEA